MNDLILHANMTMTSTQFCEMTGRSKSDINKEIRRQFQGEIDEGIIRPSLDSRGYVTEYHLPETESIMLAAKLDKTYLRKISEFWKNRYDRLDSLDLEEKDRKDLPAIKDPALMAIMETITQLDAVKQQQATQSAKLTAIEHNINYFDNYYTVAGYFSLMGEPIDLKDAKKLGMKISRRCKDRGIKPHKCPHPVYGSVNAWPEDVIAEVIEEY